MGSVTYKGPVDESDKSTVYRLPTEDGDLVFRQGVPVEDVPDSAVKRLDADEAHEFETGSSRKTKADYQVEASELGLSTDGTVEELKARIAEKHEAEASADPEEASA